MFEIVFSVDMLKGGNKAVVLVPGKWVLMTYDKIKAYVPNPKSKRGRNYDVSRRSEREDH